MNKLTVNGNFNYESRAYPATYCHVCCKMIVEGSAKLYTGVFLNNKIVGLVSFHTHCGLSVWRESEVS